MWLVECNNHGHGSQFSTTPTPCSCLHNPNIPAWNQPLYGVSTDYGARREISSTRWNPTPEQLQALEEMYRRGMRTPSAEKIQQIASKLRRFGRIEGKNVFYWFQNHKARERQKKRRQTEVFAGKKMPHVENQEGRRSGFRLEAEHPDNYNWTAPSNCNTSSEHSASMHGAGVVVVEEECKQDEWTQLLQHQKSTENYWPLDLSFNSGHQKNPGHENAKPFSALSFNKFLHTSKDDDDDDDDLRILESNQTLQLFPVASNATEEKGNDDVSNRGTKLSHFNQFFEFLPIKN